MNTPCCPCHNDLSAGAVVSTCVAGRACASHLCNQHSAPHTYCVYTRIPAQPPVLYRDFLLRSSPPPHLRPVLHQQLRGGAIPVQC